MNFFHIFRRKAQDSPRSFRVDGVATRLTPAPDEAELAAQALLENMDAGPKRRKGRKDDKPEQGSAEYYRRLAEKIRAGHAAEARLALRYVIFCEQELKNVGTPPSELERDLYAHQDAAEREGGDLLRRWQRCLALAIMRQMPAAGTEGTPHTQPEGQTAPAQG